MISQTSTGELAWCGSILEDLMLRDSLSLTVSCLPGMWYGVKMHD